MAVVLEWNGKDLPPELSALPAGRYVVESVDEPPPLTPEQDRGLQAALASLREGRSVDAEELRRQILALLAR